MKMSCFRKRRKTEERQTENEGDTNEAREENTRKRRWWRRRVSFSAWNFISSHLESSHLHQVLHHRHQHHHHDSLKRKSSHQNLSFSLGNHSRSSSTWVRVISRRKALNDVNDHLSVSITLCLSMTLDCKRGVHIFMYTKMSTSVVVIRPFKVLLKRVNWYLSSLIQLTLENWTEYSRTCLINFSGKNTWQRHALASVSFFTSKQQRQEDACWLAHPVLCMT